EADVAAPDLFVEAEVEVADAGRAPKEGAAMVLVEGADGDDRVLPLRLRVGSAESEQLLNPSRAHRKVLQFVHQLVSRNDATDMNEGQLPLGVAAGRDGKARLGDVAVDVVVAAG